jgi:general secretion pathway protein F
MARFRYRAVSRTGDALSGELEAPDRSGAVARLQALGHVPIEANAVEEGTLNAFLSLDLFGRSRVTPRSLADLLQQLATLTGAGITIEQALALLAGKDAARANAQIAETLLRRLRDGGSLADAMAANARIFPPIVVAMVRAGEQSGALETSLARLAEYLKRNETVRQTIRSALLYPAILLATATGSILIILTVVIPQLEPMLREGGAPLPLSTLLLFGLSDLIRSHAIWLIAGALLAVFGIMRALGDPAVRARRDRLLLKLAVLGDAIRRAEAARFARTLGSLVQGGVELPRAMALTLPVFANGVIGEAVAKVATSLREGSNLADPLAGTGLFPELAIQMIRVGQATGKLDEMLLKQADIFDEDVKRLIDRGLTLLVPALTIGMGLIVALVIGSIMVAMLGVNNLAG